MRNILWLVVLAALAGNATAGGAESLSCLSGVDEGQHANAESCELTVGQDGRTALCALRLKGARSVHLVENNPRVTIREIEDLERLRALREVQLIFEGKVAGRFTFANGNVVDKWLNPNPSFAYQFAHYKEITTVSGLISVATESMQTLQRVAFLEVRNQNHLSLIDPAPSEIEAAMRFPEWIASGEGKTGQWGYVIRLRGGRIVDLEVHGTPPC